MEEADLDQNGEVDYHEFVKWLHLKNYQRTEPFERHLNTGSDCVKALFRTFDKNGDGSISKREMMAVIKGLCPEFSKSQLEALFLVVDEDKDGTIDYEEFIQFLFGAPAPLSSTRSRAD